MKKTNWNILILLSTVLFIIYSRGFFQIIFGTKSPGYVLQFLFVIVLTVFIILKSLPIPRSKDKISFILPAAFILLAGIGSLVTFLKYGHLIEILLFTSVICFLFLIFSLLNILELKDQEQSGILLTALLIAGTVLFLAALLEQYRIIHFMFADSDGEITMGLPGHSALNDFIRPASLTGSMLHYAVIMPLIGALVLRFKKEWPFKLLGLLFMLVPFLVFSRSGILITTLAFLLYAVQFAVSGWQKHVRDENGKIRWNLIGKAAAILAGIILACALMILFIAPVSVFVKKLSARLLTFNDTGNSIRFGIWQNSLKFYLKTNLFFGEMTGFYSNIVQNILGHSDLVSLKAGTKVAESGFIEILTSFGLLGALAYYGTLVYSFIRIFFYRKEKFLGFVLIGAIVQTFFYQSIEVLPFMFTLALIPFFANNGGAQQEAEKSNRRSQHSRNKRVTTSK